MNGALLGVSLSSPDRVLSPRTGFGREHWIECADQMLLGVAPYASASSALIHLPGPPSQQGMRTDGLEGFARTFLLAAFLHHGDPVRADVHLERYREGLVAGTRRGGDGRESWPPIGDLGRFGQSQVEAASVALSLSLTRSAVWERLSVRECDDVAAWLASALGKEPAPNNWYLFALTIAGFLESVGRGDDATRRAITRGLQLLGHWYRGDGWYRDGEQEAYDHYNGWAMHFYPLLFARSTGDVELQSRLEERLHAFLRGFTLTFDDNGAPLYFGRSLSYRMAAVASVALGGVAGASPLTPGMTRSIASGGLRYFLERGALRGGVLSMGWHGAHAATMQSYSGPGSPYWASKAFVGLLAGPEHPFWTEPEPVHGIGEAVAAIAPAGLLVQRSATGLVRVHNHGSDHIPYVERDDAPSDPLYARVAYSTRTGPTAAFNPPDNDVSLVHRGVRSVRRRILKLAAREGMAASSFHPRFPVPSPFEASATTGFGLVLPGARIDLLTVTHREVELRIARVVGVPEGVEVRLSGWAIASDGGPSGLEVNTEGVTAEVQLADGSLSASLRGLVGFERVEVNPAPAGTAFGSWAVVPELVGRVRGGGVDVFVAAAVLASGPRAQLRAEASVEGSRILARVSPDQPQDQIVIDLDDVDWR